MTTDFLLFLTTIAIGVVFGLINDVCYIFKMPLNNLIINNVLDFIVYLSSGICVFVYVQKLNYGAFFAFELFGLLFGFILEKITCKKFVAKIECVLYNKIKFDARRLKNAIKTKCSRKKEDKKCLHIW